MLNKIIWINFIIANLFASDEFLNKCYIADEHVKDGKYVVIPQPGGKPVVVKNRSSLPALVTKRTDSSIVYPIDEYTTDPMRIDNAEKYELSYDKMASILGEHIDVLKEVTAENMLYEWTREYAYTGAGTAPATTVIKTTGASSDAHLPSATGTRKLFLKEDLKTAQFRLNKANVPKNDRFALFPSELLSQLHDDADLKKRDRGMELDMKNGVVDKLYGFQIMERSSTLIYDNTGTPVVKAPGAAAAATDNDSVKCWQKNAVERARGTIDMFQDLNNPVYYGDIYSCLVRMGGRKRRLDGIGSIDIVQDLLT